MKKIILPLIILLLVGVGIYFFTQKTGFFSSTENENLFDLKNINKNINNILKTDKDSLIGIYTDGEWGFSIRRPLNVEAQMNTSGYDVILVEEGKSNVETDKLIEGVHISIKLATLGEEVTLEEKANQLEEETRNRGELEKEMERTIINGHSGFKYDFKTPTEKGTTYLVAHSEDPSKYALIIDETLDPQGKGYKETAQQMLNTIILGPLDYYLKIED